MFKFETLVYVVLFSLAPAAFAQTPAVTLGTPREDGCDFELADKNEAGKKLRELRRTKPDSSETQKAQREFETASNRYATCRSGLRGGAGSSGEVCREAEDKFIAAIGKFSSACSTAGLDSDSAQEEGKKGAIGCSWSKNRCQCLNRKIDSETSEKYRCDELSKGSSRSADRLELGTQSLGLIDINAARKRLEACPHEDSDDTERYEKQAEKAQERIKDAKKKLPDLMTKGSEAQDKANQAVNDANRKAVEKQNDFANKLNEIKRKKEGDEQQAVAEMMGLRENIDKIDAQIRQLEMNKVDAEIKLSEAKTQIELNCHTTASQQVAALQTKQMALVNKGMPRGTFDQLMKVVGVSSRDAWIKVADIYYNRCIKSRPTRESKKAAQNIYDGTVRALDVAISNAHKSRRRSEESINQIMTTNGCTQSVAQPGGFSGETKMCRSLRQAKEDADAAYRNAAQEQDQIQQEALTAKNQLATKNQQLGTEYAEAQREIAEENKRLENLRAYLNLKREKSSGVGGKESAKQLNESYGALEAAANQMMSCSRKGENEKLTSPNLEKAYDFLESIGQKPVDVPREFNRHTAGTGNNNAGSGETQREIQTNEEPRGMPEGRPSSRPDGR